MSGFHHEIVFQDSERQTCRRADSFPSVSVFWLTSVWNRATPTISAHARTRDFGMPFLFRLAVSQLSVTVAPLEVCIVFCDLVLESQQLGPVEVLLCSASCTRFSSKTGVRIVAFTASFTLCFVTVHPVSSRQRRRAANTSSSALHASCITALEEELRVARLSMFVDHSIKLISVI